MNKYVGYESKHLSVKLDKTIARVKHLRMDPLNEFIQKLPIHKEKLKLVIDRFHGKVAIHSYSKINTKSALKMQFESNHLYHCRKAMLTPRASDPPQIPNVRSNRFMRDKDEETKKSSNTQGTELE